MADTIRYEKGDDGIVVLTLDDPNQSANTMNAAFGESLLATVERLEAEKDDIKGVVITSAKKTFFAGGDLNDLKTVTKDRAAEFAEFVRDMGLDMEKVNVNGGAIAMGHPLGATGAMLVGTLLDELERRQLRYGLVTLCVGGGMGIATIIERLA